MNHKETLERIQKLKIPVICLVNKMDISDQAKVKEKLDYWAERLPNANVFPISALHGFNIETQILNALLADDTVKTVSVLSDLSMTAFYQADGFVCDPKQVLLTKTKA